MFSKDFWYIGLLTAILLVSEVFAVLFLARHKWMSRIVLWVLAAYMFIYQIVDIARTGVFSLAFSTVAYWLFVLGAFVPWRPLKSVSAAFCLVAGCIYTSGFLFYPEVLTHQGAFGIGYINGLVLHDALIVGSLLMYSMFKVKKYDAAVIGGLLAILILFTELGAHVFHWNDVNAFFLGIIEADMLQKEIFPNLPLAWWWYILWYVVMLAALWGVWELIRFINRRLLRYNNVVSEKWSW